MKLLINWLWQKFCKTEQFDFSQKFYNAGYKAGRKAFANELHEMMEKKNL